MPNCNNSKTFLYNIQLSIDDFPEVQAALWEARAKWYNIGIRLKIEVSDLDCVNAESRIEIEGKYNRMIKLRLKMLKPSTWGEICDVLNHPTVNEPSLANKVRRQKVGPQQTHCEL